MTPTLKWLPVVGWEGFYEVSDRGDVRSVERTLDLPSGQTRTYKSKTIAPQMTSSGRHLQVQLRRPGFDRFYRIHVLVAEAFIGPRPEGLEVCHGNGDGHDNRVDNLRWGTRSSNQRDRVRHGNHHYARRTHCNNGHEFTPENTYLRPDGGGRRCRACR